MSGVALNVETKQQAWDTSAQDIPCPLCDYNLRGLVDPRCPECGYQLEWPDLLDPARRPHPYLFEHHPKRNVRSFFRTYVAALLPRRFWRRVQPIHPVRPRRLVLYWVLAASLVLITPALMIVAEYGQNVVEMLRVRSATRDYLAANPNDRFANHILNRYGSIDNALDAEYPLFPRIGWEQALQSARFTRSHAQIVAVALAWPWLTLAALMIFRASMRRAMVKSAHVLRCTLYCCDWTLWLGGLAMVVVTDHFASTWAPFFYPMASVPMLAAALFAVYTTYRLTFAYARYLKFDRPFATVAAAQVIVFLVITVVFVVAWGT